MVGILIKEIAFFLITLEEYSGENKVEFLKYYVRTILKNFPL